MAPTTRASKRHATEGPLGAPEPSPLATAPEEDDYVESSSDHACANTPESEVEPDPKTVRKHTQSTQKETGESLPKASKQARAKGKLEVFKNMPIEVFIEIAKYLHPFDLVLLLHVNKFFPVESKLKELEAAGDKDALIRWRQERWQALQDRYKNAQLFNEWFTARDSEREANLNQRKNAHEAEVTARLVSLGWDQADHLPYCNPRRKQWLSLVHTAKVLTDRGWDKLFPQLQKHLETNRRERLEREREACRSDRREQMYSFWSKAKERMLPLVQVIPKSNDIEASSLLDTVPEKNILHQPFPSYSRLNEWPEYQQLMDEDISGVELQLNLLAKENSFNEFIQKWRTQLEEALIQKLPDHVVPADFNTPGLSLITGTQPVDSLFLGTQMLLRADVAFRKEYYSCSFYPDHFQEMDCDLSQEQHIWK
ncbi:hypothetical protein OPQ81_000320 [Rhizoctonia solani]|nr:hypothetical protein OPQ81_000320 [Rhizoctonia solani]